ncbi:hydroxyethylthiazole kinase, putative [Babesia ovis]|uniref:Hydroxyethylthiazole kinase, putative n=1 Tax=Babesia ovis TaxID=5869 RepID=A0A9W5TAB9_BABOV|nr:hydroxyethylthiazole kinase, putative [Babesia ovis]
MVPILSLSQTGFGSIRTAAYRTSWSLCRCVCSAAPIGGYNGYHCLRALGVVTTRYNPVNNRSFTSDSGRCAPGGQDGPSPDPVEATSDKVVQLFSGFKEDALPEKLMELTATYWRRLRYAKPVLFTCNIDKGLECRMADALMAAGATYRPVSDITSLLEFIGHLKDTDTSVGCYINVSPGDTWVDSIGQCDQQDRDSAVVMLDVTVTQDSQPDDIARIDKMVSTLKPHIVRFVTGTEGYLAALVPDAVSSDADVDTNALRRSHLLSQRYNAVVVDNAGQRPVIVNAEDNEAVVFDRPPSIVHKVNGFDLCTGAITAAMAASSSSSAMLAAITAAVGTDYSVVKCANVAEGPASLTMNFVDKMHKVSTSPDNLLQHYTRVKFYKKWTMEPIEDDGTPGVETSDLEDASDTRPGLQ